MRALARLIPSARLVVLESAEATRIPAINILHDAPEPDRMLSSLTSTCSTGAFRSASDSATACCARYVPLSASSRKASAPLAASKTPKLRWMQLRKDSLSPMAPAGSSLGSISSRRCLATPSATLSPGSEAATGSSDEQHGSNSSPALQLSTGAALLPHPDKAYRGGEDWYFVAGHEQAFGVADGVGGWAEVGVDAGAYARALMEAAKKEAERQMCAGAPLCCQQILEHAHTRVDAQGSSTACVLVVNNGLLRASNLGDSGFMVVRGRKLLFQSPQQQHRFNFPFQLGSLGSMSDKPQQAMRFELPLLPGDVVVTGTDGLFDNVFSEEVAAIAAKCRSRGETPAVAAQVLCRYARARAADTKYNSPFSYGAMQAGYVYQGGKMDDITVLVTYVTQAAKL